MRIVVGLAFLIGVGTATAARVAVAVDAASCAKSHVDTGHANAPTAKLLRSPALAGDSDVAGTATGDLVVEINENKKHASFANKLGDDDVTAAAGFATRLAAGK
jgi:hypothetical protein